MPKRIVRLSPRAERWLFSYIADLSDKNPAAARQILIRLEALKSMLADFPEITERGILPGTRRIIMRPLILTARLWNGTLEITNVRHERQKAAGKSFRPIGRADK
ncbi:type II toxin-antitoxin system RelE/ParE family toxin [Neorhizobium alkalisoli]|uniref:Plasmid stabilization system protein ParE n=1 Tax=Neorhizobium alkalisoli TaxID=528178 RepID=A0A561R421_9HYPH|nr:type II toxin-antitoxin system RelE/ParE family toxin [Neorhizobium alkalisoli]TWF57355.1 plasmid stabilization system protein ParE [Neorhizobium alkalisoli]